MLRLFLFPLLLLSLTTNAQLKRTGDPGWSLGLNAGAGLGYRTLYTTQSSFITEAIKLERDSREDPRLAIATSFRIARQFSKRFGFEAGLGYHRTGWQYSSDLGELTFGDLIDPRRGFIYATDTEVPVEATFIDVFHYIEVPLAFTVTLGRGKLRSVSAVGIAPSFLVMADAVADYIYGDGRSERSRYEAVGDYSTFNMIPFFSTGLALRHGSRWEFRLQPTVRYGLFDIIDAPVTARVYSGTVEAGVRLAL
ncbi:MAG: outer membrane beta-barrel protein [Flavobacteriales bacterium]